MQIVKNIIVLMHTHCLIALQYCQVGKFKSRLILSELFEM
jgi:hypothetical protein